jgi:S-adenosylmethionine:tRNA ribosyltransferase-isomerase
MTFFDYELPAELIAQQPTERRDEARLLVIRRSEGTLEHRTFRDLPELLNADDLLVLNDTKVLPARLLGTRVETGGKWEGLFLHRTAEGLWELMCKTRGYARAGESIDVGGGQHFIIRDRTDDKHWLVEPDPPGEPEAILAKVGHIPLPPYIRKGRAKLGDEERYQTVFAERSGSVAAPTAGLHFTPELLDRLNAKGVGNTKVTLHVGLGTFAPVKSDDPTQHVIHREWCEASEAACDAIRNCAGRVIAVGTTAARTLETCGGQPFRGETNLYNRPPYEFKVVRGLITNFHLPRTTLLLLVGAFAGSELLRRAYEDAIRLKYRFYSYGDAMLIL